MSELGEIFEAVAATGGRERAGGLPQGPTPAGGALLQVRPDHRAVQVTRPAEMACVVTLEMRNVGTEIAYVTPRADPPVAEPLRKRVTVEPGASEQIQFAVAAYRLRKDTPFGFQAVLSSNSILHATEVVPVAIKVTDPVKLQVKLLNKSLTAPAWTELEIQLEVSRSDGHPCHVAEVTPEGGTWPHWLSTQWSAETRGTAIILRLKGRVPGRSGMREVALRIRDREQGIAVLVHRVRLRRKAAPVLVWGQDLPVPGYPELVRRDDPECTVPPPVFLPPLLPGEVRTGQFWVRNVGAAEAQVSLHVTPVNEERDWLRAGFGRAPSPRSDELTQTLLPRKVCSVWVRLEVPPVSSRLGEPVDSRTWPGAGVVLEAEGAPIRLLQPYRATVLAAIQPVPLAGRLTAAGLDLALPTIAVTTMYLSAWGLLRDYPLAMGAQSLLELLHAHPPALFPAGTFLGPRPLWLGVALLVWWVLYALLLTLTLGIYGRTPGMGYAGLELRAPDGQLVPPGKAALRGFLQALLLPLLAAVAACFPAAGNLLDSLLQIRVARVVELFPQSTAN
jgi:hypothetical protein